jgi:hypothetical protein
LEGYLKSNPEGTAVETLLYGPADGDRVDWVALEGAGFLIDCMEISAQVLGIDAKRDFKLLFTPILARHNEMLERFRHLFLETHLEKIGKKAKR